MKPVIGISGNILISKGNTFSGYRRSYVNQDYVESVLRAGGIPFIIPFNEDLESTREMVEQVDGIILSGGHDVDPYNYGEDPMLKIGEVFPKRDVFDMELYKTAIKLKKPIFGICRGYQIINVINGGTLYQDLSLIPGNVLKHNQVSKPTLKTHKIQIEENSIISEIFGKETMVNSFHHQALDKVADDFKVVARASDGVVEAIEHKTYKFLVAVQWHPEMLAVECDEARKLFNRLIEEAKK